MRASNPHYHNFLSKENPSFTSFHVTLDNLLKILHSDGVGADSVQTESISAEEENTLWETGVLNVVTPFCLRGGQEHRDLALSLLKRLKEPDRYVYSEKASKNRQGGLNQTKLEHKTVTITANPTAKERCPVFILDLYKLHETIFAIYNKIYVYELAIQKKNNETRIIKRFSKNPKCI